MTLKTTKMDIWAAEIEDRPGSLARTMQAIAESGADLECVLARREGDKPGKGTLFVTPLLGKDQLDKAEAMGMHRATTVSTLRIEGENHPGMGADLARAIGEVGVNLHGLTAATIGNRFVCYASFDSVTDLDKADQALRKLDTRHWPKWKDLLHRKEKDKSTVTA